MIYAAKMMTIGRNNKLYGWLRRKFQSICKQRIGEKNGSYGSFWITNGVESKKIKGEIPEGWTKGRVGNFVAKKLRKLSEVEILKRKKLKEHRESLNVHKKSEIKILYNTYYKVYNELGFNKFCELFGYNKTQQNLVMQFKKYVDSFVPQKGIKRILDR